MGRENTRTHGKKKKKKERSLETDSEKLSDMNTKNVEDRNVMSPISFLFVYPSLYPCFGAERVGIPPKS